MSSPYRFESTDCKEYEGLDSYKSGPYEWRYGPLFPEVTDELTKLVKELQEKLERLEEHVRELKHE